MQFMLGARAVLRLAIWYKSDRRPILSSYLPPHGGKDARSDMLVRLDSQPSADAKAVALAELMKDERDLDTVFALLKASKTDEYLLDPGKLFGQSDIREALHILRPLLYGKKRTTGHANSGTLFGDKGQQEQADAVVPVGSIAADRRRRRGS